MITKVFNLEGAVVEELDLSFLSQNFIKLKHEFIQDCINKLRKINRVKTAHTKTKVSGTTKKSFRQKGTGRARQGAGYDPHNVGGRIIFGPLAIQRKVSIQKSEIRLAKQMLVSEVFNRNIFSLVSSVKIANHKTKNTVNIMKTFGGKKVLCIHDNEIEQNNLISASNLQGFHYSKVDSLTIYDLLLHDKFIITKSAANKLVEIFN